MLPREITQLLEVYSSDNIAIYVTRAEHAGDRLLLDIIMEIKHRNDAGKTLKFWSVEARGYRKSLISFDVHSHIALKHDHPAMENMADAFACSVLWIGHSWIIAHEFDFVMTRERG